MTQVFKFSASHRLYIDSLSVEENFNIFDRCSNFEGHGHDYVVEVKVENKIDDKSGMVINHLWMNREGMKIIEKLNYRWIDRDVDHFKINQSTVENIGIYLWREFFNIFGEKLSGIKIWENNRSYFEYYEEIE